MSEETRLPAPVGPLRLRVGHAERDAVCAELAEQFGVGRLDEQELNRRLDQAVAAHTRGQLAGLVADLPADPRRVNAVAAAPAPVGGWLLVAGGTFLTAVLMLLVLGLAMGPLVVPALFGGLMTFGTGVAVTHVTLRARRGGGRPGAN